MPIRSSVAKLVICSCAFVAGCDVVNEMAICSGPVVKSPDGECAAYYFKMFSQPRVSTHALVECGSGLSKIGGGVLSHHNANGHGIGFQWLDAGTLEISVHPDAEIYGYNIPDRHSDQFGKKQIKYTYQQLTADDAAWLGCTRPR